MQTFRLHAYSMYIPLGIYVYIGKLQRERDPITLSGLLESCPTKIHRRG